MGKMSLTSCRALSTPGKFSNVDRYAEVQDKRDRSKITTTDQHLRSKTQGCSTKLHMLNSLHLATPQPNRYLKEKTTLAANRFG